MAGDLGPLKWRVFLEKPKGRIRSEIHFEKLPHLSMSQKAHEPRPFHFCACCGKPKPQGPKERRLSPAGEFWGVINRRPHEAKGSCVKHLRRACPRTSSFGQFQRSQSGRGVFNTGVTTAGPTKHINLKLTGVGGKPKPVTTIKVVKEAYPLRKQKGIPLLFQQGSLKTTKSIRGPPK